MTDPQLLHEYCQRRTESAFAELVQRHAGWVYAAALRQVRDSHVAEDVTQAVFIALAKKAPRLSPEAAVSGWLFRATRFAASHAIQAESRRQKHERRAAAMVSEISVPPTEAEWEPLAPHLDGLVGQLGKKDQQVILLRFYQQKMFIEVGRAMGISEEAARKRTDRAVERLRGMFAWRGLTIGTSANLALAMTQNLSHPPVPLLVSTATKAALAGNGTALVNTALRMMTWAAAKTAAAIMAIGIAIAATAIIVARAAGPASQPQASVAPVPPAAPQSTSYPTTLPEPENVEGNVLGVAQLIRWDVILNKIGADDLGDVGFPVPTASKIYKAISCSSVELRQAINRAVATGGLIRGSMDMDVAEQQQAPLMSLSFVHRPGLLYLTSYLDAAPGDRQTYFSIQSDSEYDSFERVGSSRVRLKLRDDSQMRLDIQENPAARARGQWAQYKPTIMYDGEISAGHALAFMGRFPGASGREYFHVIVWEVFTATEKQMPFIAQQHGSEWWARNGPGVMRKWADTAIVWIAGAANRPAATGMFEQKLEDGKIARVQATCQPSQWPFCWWDARGEAIDVGQPIALMGDPPEGNWAIVTVNAPTTEYQQMGPAGDTFGPDPYRDSICEKVSDSGDSVEAGILVGPWMELGRLQIGRPFTKDGVTYLLDKPEVDPERGFGIDFTKKGVLDDANCVTITGSSGKQIEPYWHMETIVTGLNHGQAAVNDTLAFNRENVPLQDVKEFRLWSRKRQWITFRGFPTSPKTPPTITDIPAKISSPPQTSPASSP